MYWNHRVFKTNNPHGDEYEIREVYYDEETDAITAYTGEGHAPWGVDMDDLRWVLEHMLASLDKPVIDEAELEAYFEERREERENNPPEEEEYEVYNSVEEFLAALEEDSNDGEGRDSK